MSSSTEERITAALTATARGITMDTSTMNKRFAEIRDRGESDRRRRRRTAAGAAALTAAAAVAAAVVLGGGLLGGDDRGLPDVAEPPPAVTATLPSGVGFPVEGDRYATDAFAVPFSFVVPPKGDLQGAWRYEAGGAAFGLGLDGSVATGFAGITMAELDQVYDPRLRQPFVGQSALVDAPTDAAGWTRWLEQTGVARVTSTEELDLGGVRATRLGVEVSDDIPAQSDPCVTRESCLPLSPQGPSLVGRASQQQFTSELTVLEVDGRDLVIVTMGAQATQDAWLPLLRSVVDSLRFG